MQLTHGNYQTDVLIVSIKKVYKKKAKCYFWLRVAGGLLKELESPSSRREHGFVCFVLFVFCSNQVF